MKVLALLFLICFGSNAYAQPTALPHGMVFGQKPDTMAIVEAVKLEAFMGKKPRISTTIRGKIIDVKKEKGGWFTLDAGNGKLISAHFKKYDIILPAQMSGRIVIIEGIAFKQFIPGNRPRLSGDTATVKGGTPRGAAAIAFEASGLLVYK